MREPAEMGMGPRMPRPGKALKGVLATVAIVAVVGAVVVHWAPGGARGAEWFRWLTFDPDFSRPWALVTSALLTSPKQLSHVFFTLIGLYFLTPDLERRWGGARLIRFLLFSAIAGNLVVAGVDRLPVTYSIFHPVLAFGPGAALTATSIAWSRENQNSQIRLFFALPVSGKTLFWVTIGFCVLGIVFSQEIPEGAFGLFGGVITGMLLSGSPSPFRSAYLRVKLALLRRKGATLTVESITGKIERPRAKRSGKGGPSLRVVYGGLEDELKNRKPPKDKRHLN